MKLKASTSSLKIIKSLLSLISYFKIPWAISLTQDSGCCILAIEKAWKTGNQRACFSRKLATKWFSIRVITILPLTDLSTVETACFLMQLFTTFRIAIKLKTYIEYVEYSSITNITYSGRFDTGFEDFTEVCFIVVSLVIAIAATEAYVGLGFG
jgi:hypothetical protein